ncbi:hypothetical protein AB5J52_46450 [Streptomyces sp. R39]|uniref:Uncharacterized protein n=1 Tax=Streptomyces sp. R39 TaxID=3238631 RepID=A0AB39QZQ6_9ACTN
MTAIEDCLGARSSVPRICSLLAFADRVARFVQDSLEVPTADLGPCGAVVPLDAGAAAAAHSRRPHGR